MTFHYVDNRLFAEDVPLSDIATRHGTPVYVYSRAILEGNYDAYDSAFGDRRHQICYAVKANGNLAILDLLARRGAAFDIVSIGELERVRAAGADVSTITFAGVGKTYDELQQAAAAGIGCFNVETAEELERLSAIGATASIPIPISIRVNPDVDPKTHPYISTGLNENKFGIPMADATALYDRAKGLPAINVRGVACHIGSQLVSSKPIVDAAERIMALVERLEDRGFDIQHVDIGGGLGIAYDDEQPPPIEEYVDDICSVIDERYEIVIEPGRSIVGAAGAMLTRVHYLKSTPAKTFAICDASMTELIRPALYQAKHRIQPVGRGAALRVVDVVGPVCETADFIARDCEVAVDRGELLCVRDCGAYGFVMASNYNARPRPPEVLVDGASVHLIREKETISDLFRGEHRLAVESVR